MANKNLNAAKTAKKDEFYTQMSDIETELQHYWQHFHDKVVLCNCDDPNESYWRKSNTIAPTAKNTPASGKWGDRITPWCEGGRTVETDSQMLCRECNYKQL